LEKRLCEALEIFERKIRDYSGALLRRRARVNEKGIPTFSIGGELSKKM